MPPPRSYSTFGSTMLTVAMRWTDRLIGVVSMLVLARLLLPEDFGIIAMASLAIALVDILMAFGVHVALIRNQHATQAHYDTAWTLRLLQTSASTVLVILVAPLAAAYFEDPRVQPVLQLLAFSLVLAGFENIGVVDFQKRMQFGAEFRFLFLRRMAGFLITVTAAVALRSYWALVIGTLAGQLAGVGLSYRLHPMRPRFSFEHFGEIFAVSQWMLVNNVGSFFHRNLHKILVGRWAPTSTMGAYSLADDISGMPAGELLAPLNRALFPAFARANGDPGRLKDLFLRAQGVQTLVAVPMAAGLALVAADAVPLVLGPNWLLAIPFIEVLALANIAQALAVSGAYLLIVVGHIRTCALYSWIQALVFVALALTLFYEADALSIAALRLAVAAGALGLLLWLLLRALPFLSAREVVAQSIRPLVAAAAMAVVLLNANDPGLPAALALAMKIALGAAVYVLALAALWWGAGRPSGAESYVLEKLRALAAARRRSGEAPEPP